MNLSFAGCGFLGIYHIGVASCLREYAPHLLSNKIAGASVGSIAAAALVCGVPLGQTTTTVLKVAVQARSHILGPLSPRFSLNEIIKESLMKALPENAHILCSGRLFISCTRLNDGKNVLLSEFSSRDELIQALLCSCFIPIYSGIFYPVVRGMSLFDGGFSNNLPALDANTITVSPFAGEHDICPQDENCNILQINIANTSISVSPGNLYRIAKILFPPHPEVLNKMCQQGFDDALKYLQRHNLIACTRCIAVQSCLTVSDVCDLNDASSKNGEHIYDNCIECRYRRQMALLDSLPPAVVQAINDVCDQVNKGIMNWVFSHRPMQMLSVLGLPYDISMYIFLKLVQKLPHLLQELESKFHGIVLLIKTLIHKFNTSRHLYSAKFSCQLAVTEFDYTEEDISSSYVIPKKANPPHDTCTLITEQEQSQSEAKDEIIVNANQLSIPPQQTETKQQRKSYAGCMNVNKELNAERNRRMSMCDTRQPERVLRNMKFGFTLDLQPNVSSNNGQKQNVVDALQSLGEEEGDIIEITNKALNFERECIDKCPSDMKPENADTLQKILGKVATDEAVMSYYYLDDSKTLKVTEVYNVDDADTNAVLSEDIQDSNPKSCWKDEWLHDPNLTSCDFNMSSVSDSFDDREFSMSDNECELKEEETLQPLKSDKLNSDNLCSEKIINTQKPKRKTSFIIVR